MHRLTFCAGMFAILLSANFASASDTMSGFLKLEKKTPNGKVEHEVLRYVPREGDMIFFDDRHTAWTVLFAYAGTGPPLHMGMVFKKTDGSLAALEAGPDDTTRVTIFHLEKRLHQFQQHFPKGTITIRRCKKELPAELSKDLTKFAQAQDGKRYAVGRLLLQGTSLRARGPLGEMILGKTVLDRDSWICSELSVAAGTVAKLFDLKVVFSNVAYPRDLVDNARYDLRENWHDAAVWMPKRASE
jgi:hypothetical protein